MGQGEDRGAPARPGVSDLVFVGGTVVRIPTGQGAQTPISRKELVEAMVADRVPARFQLQMHKFIWPSDERGV